MDMHGTRKTEAIMRPRLFRHSTRLFRHSLVGRSGGLRCKRPGPGFLVVGWQVVCGVEVRQ